MPNYNPAGATCIQLLQFFLENLLPVWPLVRTNLFIPSRFWTTYTKFDNCCLRYIATCSNARRSGLGAWQKKNKKKQTPHFRTYSRRALCDLPQTLHGDRARRAHHKRCHPFFDLIHSFSARRLNVDFWLLSKNNTGRLPLRGILPVITMRSRRFPANSASDCLRFAKFRPQFSTLVALPTNGSAKCLVRYKARLLL